MGRAVKGVIAAVGVTGLLFGVAIATAPSGSRPTRHKAPAAQCLTRAGGQLPDPVCTPGVADPRVTQATIGQTICVHGWTATVRYVPALTKAAVRAAYNDHQPGEIDHLISLELGGSNEVTNLWPEDGPIPNAKDLVENRLHRAVCLGQMTLLDAQRKIATDWRLA